MVYEILSPTEQIPAGALFISLLTCIKLGFLLLAVARSRALENLDDLQFAQQKVMTVESKLNYAQMIEYDIVLSGGNACPRNATSRKSLVP